MSFIPVSNFVSVSVSSPPAGLREYAVNNLAIFTSESPVNGSITASNPGIYLSPTDVATDWGDSSEVFAQANLIFSQSPNILDGGGSLIISPIGATPLATAITAARALNFFGGALVAGSHFDGSVDSEIIAASTAAQAARVMLFVSAHLASALTTTTGLLWKITDAGDTQTRCLLYIVGGTALAAREMAAAYAGRAMSVAFDGASTTATMHLKDLTGINSDTGITQTILDSCKTVGVDCYPSVGGGAQYIGKVFSTGANGFYDDIYNLNWLVFALQVAGFNALATTSTKLPQTEPGMAVLKGAYIAILQQAVANGFVAPGQWNSPELFGSPADLKRCISNLGYYIYSLPVNQQTQAARETRAAPLVRIAIKYAGAIHSSDVLVTVNQ